LLFSANLSIQKLRLLLNFLVGNGDKGTKHWQAGRGIGQGHVGGGWRAAEMVTVKIAGRYSHVKTPQLLYNIMVTFKNYDCAKLNASEQMATKHRKCDVVL